MIFHSFPHFGLLSHGDRLTSTVAAEAGFCVGFGIVPILILFFSLHHMGMNQSSRFPMHQNMGIPGMGTNPNMSAYGHHPQQWAAYGGPGNGPRGY